MISTKKGQNYGITSKNSLEIPQNYDTISTKTANCFKKIAFTLKSVKQNFSSIWTCFELLILPFQKSVKIANSSKYC